MKRAYALIFILSLIAGLTITTAAQASPGRYIVVLQPSVGDPGAVASEHARDHGAQVRHVYRWAIKGYSATMSEQGAQRVASDARVAYVEADSPVQAVHHRPDHGGGPGGGGGDDGGGGGGGTTCDPAAQLLPWGVDRIDGDLASVLGDCIDDVTNVNAYVIDTGVDAGHADLNVVNHVNFASGPNKDCNGHGTHVAGTIAARDNSQDVVGVAPGAPLTGVKVLGCGGSGWTSDVIAGVDWVTKNAVEPAVANMSLGGSTNQSLDDAVKSSADSGVTYSIAAGNDGDDACGHSPARAGTHAGVITTAATDSSDLETSWSNYGSCVDLWAPGASIESTASGGGTTTMSGTSMAAPHVGGTAAQYLSSQTGASASTVEGALKTDAQTLTTQSKDGSFIELLYAGNY